MEPTPFWKRDGTKAWLLLLALTLIWGSSFILIKKGLIVYSPLEVAALRIITAGLFLAPAAYKGLRKLSNLNWQMLLLIGFVGSFFPAFLFSLAQTRLDSGLAGALNALTPLFTVLIGRLFFKAAITPKNLVGMAIGFVGTVTLIVASGGDSVSSLNYYALLIVLATVMYGINVNVIKAKLSGLKPLTITSVSLNIVMPLALIILITATDFSTKVIHTDGAWIALAYVSMLGVMGTAIALVMFNRMVQLSSPLFSSSVTYLIPIVAVLWGLLDGEVLTITHFVSMALIILGVYIANNKRAK